MCSNVSLYAKNSNSSDLSIKYIGWKKILVSFSIIITPCAHSNEYFNLNALEAIDGIQNKVSLDSFSSRGSQMPGVYRVDIYVNDNKVDTRSVDFSMYEGKLQPVLFVSDLILMGVKTEALPKLSGLSQDYEIRKLGDFIPAAESVLDFGQQRLNISIPQAAMKNDARGYVDPSLWDQGLPAFFTNYSFTGSKTNYKNGQEDGSSSFLNLRTGLNFGAWRLRNYSTWNNSNNDSSHWNSINTYLQRDITTLKSQFLIGDTNTASEVFDSVSFKGVQISSDDNMLPDSLRGFAPVVRGIAQSNAQVTVSQNNNVIYQTYVAPGAFEINDLYPTASSGNLEIKIKEADGRERIFIQPFSAAPIMQREGRLKYSVSTGKYDSQNNNARKPNFVQSTMIYGLPYDSTVYGGILGADNYKSLAVGVGHGFGDIGSLSFDVTFAKSNMIDESKKEGESFRLQYAKSLVQTGTSITVAGYRYSTSGFYDFSEANELQFNNSDSWRLQKNKRSKTQVNISQSFGEYGSMFLSGYQQDYWQTKGYERNASLGYNISFSGITYGLNYTWSQMPNGKEADKLLAFNMQIPLSKWMPNSWVTYNSNSVNGRNPSHQIGIGGTALSDNRLSYSLQTNRNEGAGSNSSSTSVSYKGGKGIVNLGYNYNNISRQINYGVQGAAILHPYGFTLAQPIGDTFALVRAPEASGVKIQNNAGVYTDWAGNAIIPYVTTYRKNRIALESDTLGEDVEIDTKVKTVIPTQGALVMAKFDTRVGLRAFLTLKHNGQFVPFGANAVLEGDNTSSGIVGSNGELYMSGLPYQGNIRVKWGPDKLDSCNVELAITEKKVKGILTLIRDCK